jgi:intracellular multiplication protein IcmL
MAIGTLREKYISRENSFYRDHYHQVIMVMMGVIVILMIAVGVVLYQTLNRPLPQFNAVQSDGKRMLLFPYEEPNLLPDTILRFASKAATVSYTFDFLNANKQVLAARPFYTPDGWLDYLNSVSGVISSIVQNQLFVYGVVAGTPVISNQGPLPGKDYVWRVQIPFLVTYVNAQGPNTRSFYVVLSIVRVPTYVSPQGIGIDQFVMRQR